MDTYLDMALKYVVIPVAAFVYGLHMRVQAHHTDLAVIRERIDGQERARQASEAKIDKSIDAIMQKLDSIEAALRK